MSKNFDQSVLGKILGVVIADILRFILENDIPLVDTFQRIELKKFLPGKISETKVRMIKIDELKENLHKAYHNSRRNVNLGNYDTLP